MAKKYSFSKMMAALVALTGSVVAFQNCSPGFKVSEESQISLSSVSDTPTAPAKCALPDGSQLDPEQFVSGFILESALSPATCGVQVRRTCLSGGSFDGPVPVFQSCRQQCVNPGDSQPMNAGATFVYFSKASGVTQADCDSARLTSTCEQETGLLNPPVPVAAQRFATCLVQGQTCAYTSMTGTATPSGNMTNATVSGFAYANPTYPTLCGASVTRTCQVSGQWSDTVPLYTACTQNCVHPDTNQPVSAGTQLSYFTRSSGTAAECAAAARSSICQQATGLFSPTVVAARFSTCQIVVPPPPTPTPTPAGVGMMPADFSVGSLRVCLSSSCPYRLPSQALAAAKDGAVIEIMSGDYPDCMTVRLNGLTVRGVGATRPHLSGKICGDKAIIVNAGADNRYENLELSNFSNASYNGAGVRQDTGLGKNLVIENFYFHDGQMGIMGGTDGDKVYVNNSLFQRVGVARPDGEISVPIFTHLGDLLQIRKSIFKDSVGGASFVKSRAKSVVIDCSSIAALDTRDSYTIDYQTGGKLSVFNSVIEQGPMTDNSTMITINSVSYNASIENALVLKGNIIINDKRSGTIVNFARTVPSSVDVTGNMFIGGGNIFNASTLKVESSNIVLNDRPAAIGAYPSLPSPGTCTTIAP